MNPLDRLNDYLRRLERRLRLSTVSRGAAIIAVAALAATVVLVLFANSRAFSEASVTTGRVLLFLLLALAVCFGLWLPWLRVNRRTAARWIERRFPELEQRLLTFAERDSGDARRDPFLALLAADTASVTDALEPRRVTPRSRIVAFFSAAAAAAGVLLWLVVAGPGFLGYGASLLWAGPARTGTQPFYDIQVTPGNHTVRRGADQLVTAQPIGMQPSQVRLLARYRGASKWEQAVMQPPAQGSGYQFVFAGIPETAEYYVEAGGVRSKTYTLTVLDLAAINKIRVTYRYPDWTGMKAAVEDPGGDLRAVEGTEAEVAILTDRPLRNGAIAIDDGTRTPLASGEGNWVTGRVAIQKDGLYHITVNDRGQEVRLSEDFFIEARKATPPLVRVVRPGKDAKVTPIEEMTVGVEAEDDFALQDVTLHYSVNGGPEKTVPMLGNKGARKAEGENTLYLEDYKLVPGDVVSLYASARNARSSTNTDMMFIEAQPFEREYSQSQEMGGGGGGQGGDEDGNRISARQKEIIAATWNEIRDRKDKATAADDGKFLSGVQAKLRDQARSLAKRMTSRELSGANDEFKKFSRDMNAAAEAMQAASEKLKSQEWKDALPSEQQALQHLLRAEATFRQIQVAFGQRGGGGGGGGGAARDLENLFDLELDTEKNQYEAGRQASSPEQRAREVDEALQKLEQLARRQQELADQARQQKQQAFEQRWQQELLRREAEELQKQLEQLTRGQTGQQSGQQSQQGQQQGQQAGQQGSERSLRAMAGGNRSRQQTDPRVERALERLEQATRDMRGSQGGQQNDTQARRAAERLEEARQLLRGLRSQQSTDQIGDLSRTADRLASQQKDFADRLQQAYPNPAPESSGLMGRRQQWMTGPDREKAQKLADEKAQLANQYQELERQLQEAIRGMANSQRAASSKLREALGEAQKDEVGLRLKQNAEFIRRGLGAYTAPREAPVTQGLERLADQLRQAQAALDKPGKEAGLEQALANVERLRAEMERAAAQGSRGRQRGAQQGSRQGGGDSMDNSGAMNRGDLEGPGALPPTSELNRAFAQGLRDLGDLRNTLQGQGLPELSRDVQTLIRDMQRLDPKRFPGNPALVDQLATQLLPAIEQLELQLRRNMEQAGGSVRAGSAEPVPAGYAEAVAEYFRRLSKTR